MVAFQGPDVVVDKQVLSKASKGLLRAIFPGEVADKVVDEVVANPVNIRQDKKVGLVPAEA